MNILEQLKKEKNQLIDQFSVDRSEGQIKRPFYYLFQSL